MKPLTPLALALFALTHGTSAAPTVTLTVTLGTNVLSEAPGFTATEARVLVHPPPKVNLTLRALVFEGTNISPKIEPPPSVTLRAGSTNATIPLLVNDDGAIDGTRFLVLRFGADGAADVQLPLTVQDDDTSDRRTIGGSVWGRLAAPAYTATRDVLVPENQQLIIDPAVQLRFPRGTVLAVMGRLTAVGSPGREIRFAGTSSPAAPADWEGLRIVDAYGPTVILQHVEIAHARTGVHFGPNFIDPPSGRPPHLQLAQSSIHRCRSNAVTLAVGRRITPNNRLVDADEVQIVENRLGECGGYGVYVYADAYPCGGTHHAATVSDNEILNNALAGIGLFLRFASGCNSAVPHYGFLENRILGNHVHGNGGRGIDAFAQASRTAIGRLLPRIEQNLIANNRGDGIALLGGSLAQMEASVAHNTIVGNAGFGIVHNTNIVNLTIRNNLLVQNRGGIKAQAAIQTSTNLIVQNNLVWANSGADWVNYPTEFGSLSRANRNGTPADFAGNFAVNPLFQIDGLDFHLSPVSPARNAGSTNNPPAVDYDGDLRDGYPDVGYDETQGLGLTLVRTGDPTVLQLTLAGTPGSRAVIESSADLIAWSTLTQAEFATPQTTLLIPRPPEHPRLFIRAREL